LLTLSELHIYPVKSCAGSQVESVQLDRFGPTDDRRWMLVDQAGEMVSQRDEPKLALMRAEVDSAGISLAFDGKVFPVMIDSASAQTTVQVWGDRVLACDAGNEVAEWLSDALQRSLRLVYMPDDSVRRVDTDFALQGETVSFADGFPLLLVSQASLDYLGQRLSRPVPTNRFRPNLVVTGCEPHAEDAWKKIRIGDIEFDVAKACARCVMPSIEQSDASKDPDILRELASYRRFDDPAGGPRQVYFGQNLLYTERGLLQVGDRVTVCS